MSNSGVENYGHHVCAFMDILGFSNWVRRISASRDDFNQLISVLWELKTRTDAKKHDDGAVCYHNREITVFSDSIVISYPVPGPNPVQPLCNDLIWLARRLLEKGVLTRGAVTVGRLFHHDGIVFGDAFLEAHRIEKKIAIYPRIVVQDEVLRVGTWPKDAPAFNSQLREIDEPMSCERDFDGVRFLNPLNIGFWSVEQLNSPSNFLKRVRETILIEHKRAVSEKDSKVLVKLAWLAKHFNAALKQARRHQDQVRDGHIVSNYHRPYADENYCDIEEIDCNQWPILPLNKDVELPL